MVKRIRTLLTLFLLLMGTTMSWAEFKDFELDLTKNPVADLPAGVKQISYPQNGAGFNGAQHGWMWYAIEFDVDGPVDIAVGGCQYINAGSEAYLADASGNKIADINNKTTKCFDADGSCGTYRYQGGAQTLRLYCGQYCPNVKVSKVVIANDFEINLVTTAAPSLPTGVKQISYPQNGVNYRNGDGHGTSWYAIEFNVDGPVDITLGGCQYINAGYEAYLTDASGNKIADIPTKTSVCGDVTYKYKGKAETLRLYCGQYCSKVQVSKPFVFKDFEIDLTTNPVEALPAGVKQISYPQNGVKFNGSQHGWQWYAIEFAVDGPVDIAVGGCQYINAGYEAYLTDASGNKIADINNKTAKCFDADGSCGTYQYTGEAQTLRLYCGQYCPNVKVSKHVPFRGFEVDLTSETPTLPKGVSQIMYADNAPAYNGNQHGWMWYAVEFAVDGPAKITLGGCQYINAGFEGYVTDASGNKLGDISNKTANCWHSDGSSASFDYIGEAGILRVYCGQYCPYIKVKAVNPKEKSIYKTDFQNWTAASASSSNPVKVTTTDKQDVTFSLTGTLVDPNGVNSDKLTAECITPGYLRAEKSTGATITTTEFANVTTVTYVHGATGGKDQRGWGLRVKGDGDADWVTLNGKGVNPITGTEVTVEVYRTNVQLQFYNLVDDQNAFLTSIDVKGEVEAAPRTFADFKIDFRSNPYKVVAPEAGLPEGVTVDGTFHDAQHGYNTTTIKIPVDGPVKLTFGSCQYGNGLATITDSNGKSVTVGTNAGCDTNTSTDKFVTWKYNNENPTVLTVTTPEYIPFFYAEACEYVPVATVAYYDTDGSLLGEEEVEVGSKLAYKYSASDVKVGAGKAFRGWFENANATALKVAEGKSVTDDIKLYAKATNIEKAVAGSHFDYNMTVNYFYPEDHELIDFVGGKYHNNHGWILGADEQIKVQVAGKSYIVVKNCQYSNSQEVVVTDAKGNKVGTFDAKVAGDGAGTSVTYDGPATTLTFTFANTAYVHGVEIYNVEKLIAYDEPTHTFNIPAGDATTLQLAIKVAKEGDIIRLPNAVYDFGTSFNNSISTNNLSIIGESRDGVIIKNTPVDEGIDRTATLYNISTGLYMQDLTINCYAPCKSGNERGVCFLDAGTKTICKNVYIKGYQDSYYSNGKEGMVAYFEGGKIEGTVDFLCGSGSVLFNRVNLICVSSANKKSGDCIAAPATYQKELGYVMSNCLITGAEAQDGTYRLARGWKNYAAATFVGTRANIAPADGYWGSDINALSERRFAYYPKSKDANALPAGVGNLTNFVTSVSNNYPSANLGDWDPAAIIASHCPLKTNGAGWASMTAFSDVELHGVQAYVATEISNATVTLEPIEDNKVPAGTGVFINGDPFTEYTYARATDLGPAPFNLIKPVEFDTVLTSDDQAYIVGTLSGVPGMYMVSAPVDAPADKAYLDASSIWGSKAKEFLAFVIGKDQDETTTSVNTLKVEGSAVRYNVSGQKVGKGYKGIVIENGKAILVK